jgi:hypothetical protein
MTIQRKSHPALTYDRIKLRWRGQTRTTGISEITLNRRYASTIASFQARTSDTDLPDGQFCEIGVQPCNEKYSACAVGQISGTESGRLASIRGTYASSRTLRWDAVDAKVLRDERHYRGRRNRVVLTPRRWRQVFAGNDSRESDGGKRARSPGRARDKPLKPLRRKRRTVRQTCGDYARVLPSFRTRGCGCGEHPVFPAPSYFRGTIVFHNSGAICAAGTRSHGANGGPATRGKSWLAPQPNGSFSAGSHLAGIRG